MTSSPAKREKRHSNNRLARETPSVKARIPGNILLPDQIAMMAYYRAQSRGFAPGNELDDWLQAEAELQAQAA